MEYLEAPNRIESFDPNAKRIFLAGGITGCPDWQAEVVNKLKDEDNLYVFSPRRKDFDVSKKEESLKQIKWERDYLYIADIISFWFCADQIQPITLFELGKYAFLNKKIIIGVDPKYPRKLDVYTQVKLENPDKKIHNNLDGLIKEIREV